MSVIWVSKGQFGLFSSLITYHLKYPKFLNSTRLAHCFHFTSLKYFNFLWDPYLSTWSEWDEKGGKKNELRWERRKGRKKKRTGMRKAKRKKKKERNNKLKKKKEKWKKKDKKKRRVKSKVATGESLIMCVFTKMPS